MMTKQFRMNSTKLVPTKKPRIVDNYKKRNLNSNLPITIPFNVDLDTGISQNVYSIDTMSLLAGSSTFNHFVKVFDQFKVQSVHMCIDLAAPSTCTYTMKAIYTCPLYTGSFGTTGYSIVSNGQPEANSPETFCGKLKELMTTAGMLTNEGKPVITDGSIVNFGRILLWIVSEGKMAALSNKQITNDGQPHEIFNEGGNTIVYNMAANEEPNITINCTSYQQIGAAGLRQIPKGFYNAPNFNDQVRMKPNIYEEGFIESIGNYIHQSYMPGAPLHLSLDMIGTSATEKSLYFPTAVVENISAFDSINMCGRFAPVCLVQNKVKVDKGRDILVNGHAVENAYAMKYDNVGLTGAINIQKYNLVFTITISGVAHTVTIPVSYCPTYYGMNGTLSFNVASVYTCIGKMNNEGEEYDGLADITQNNWETYIYPNMPLSNIGYCLYQNDNDYKMGGGQLSIQCYIDVRFKDLRNTLNNVNINYPYLQGLIKGQFTLENEKVYIYNDCNLISTVDFIKSVKHLPTNTSIQSQMFLKPSTAYEDGAVDDQGIIDIICRKVKGNQAFNIANAVHGNMYLNNFNYKNKVLGGIIIPVKKNSVPRYCIFNTFSITPNTDYTVNEVYGADQPVDDEFYVFTLVLHVVLVNKGTIEAPNIQPIEGDITVRDSTCGELDYNTVPGADGKVDGSLKWKIKNYNFDLELNLSRVRSIGYSDGAFNSIVEHHLNPEWLKTGRGVVDMNNEQRNGVYVVRSFGGIVGAAPGSVTNQL